MYWYAVLDNYESVSGQLEISSNFSELWLDDTHVPIGATVPLEFSLAT